MLGRRIALLLAMSSLCLGLFTGLMASPATAAQGTPCPEPTSEELAAIAASWFAAIGDHDLEAMAALSSPEITQSSRLGEPAVGIEAVQANYQGLLDAFPDLQTTTNLIITQAPRVVTQYTTTGTQAIPFQGSEPSGEAAIWDGINMLTVECGKIVAVTSYSDQLARINQGTSAPASPVAADDAASSPAACPALTDDAARQLMESWYHDIWTGDFTALETITTVDVYHHWAMGPDTSGQAAQNEQVQRTASALAGMTSTYDTLVVDGDFIAVSWEQSLGDDTWSGLNIFRTECGLIDEVWSEMDITGLPPQE